MLSNDDPVIRLAAIESLGDEKSRSLVKLVAAGMRNNSDLDEVLYHLRRHQRKVNISQMDSDIVILQQALAKETVPILIWAFEEAIKILKLNQDALKGRV